MKIKSVKVNGVTFNYALFTNQASADAQCRASQIAGCANVVRVRGGWAVVSTCYAQLLNDQLGL